MPQDQPATKPSEQPIDGEAAPGDGAKPQPPRGADGMASTAEVDAAGALVEKNDGDDDDDDDDDDDEQDFDIILGDQAVEDDDDDDLDIVLAKPGEAAPVAAPPTAAAGAASAQFRWTRPGAAAADGAASSTPALPGLSAPTGAPSTAQQQPGQGRPGFTQMVVSSPAFLEHARCTRMRASRRLGSDALPSTLHTSTTHAHTRAHTRARPHSPSTPTRATVPSGCPSFPPRLVRMRPCRRKRGRASRSNCLGRRASRLRSTASFSASGMAISSTLTWTASSKPHGECQPFPLPPSSVLLSFPFSLLPIYRTPRTPVCPARSEAREMHLPPRTSSLHSLFIHWLDHSATQLHH